MRPLIRPGDVVLDVGANIGTHTIPLATMVGAAGAVLAFEPQRLAFQMLCGNVALNGLENVRAYQAALGASSGEIQVPGLPSPATPFNFGAVPLQSKGPGEKVDLRTLDSIGLAACRLIKIDVEGMEADVIAGAAATIARLQPFLFVENNTVDGASRTIEAVFGLGYRAYWHISPYYHEQNFYANTQNVFARYQPEANLLCAPKSSPVAVRLPECTGPDDDWKKALERSRTAK
ncbi:MAG TPA: FkbM family methyltransferase [Burkholderiales bacterium]|nr:FkbM family methyltransferase [Burkholderiales bacterium]